MIDNFFGKLLHLENDDYYRSKNSHLSRKKALVGIIPLDHHTEKTCVIRQPVTLFRADITQHASNTSTTVSSTKLTLVKSTIPNYS